MRLEGWLRSVAGLSWAIRRDEEQGLRDVLRTRSIREAEDDADDSHRQGSLPLPRQSGFARGAS